MWKVASIYIPSLMDKICPSLSCKESASQDFLREKLLKLSRKKIIYLTLICLWYGNKCKHRRNAGRNLPMKALCTCLIKLEDFLEWRVSWRDAPELKLPGRTE